MIYVLFPTHDESAPFFGLLEGQEQATVGMRPGVMGRLHGASVTAVVSGVGQANTAQSVAALLCMGPARLIVLCGSAGAYAGSGLSVGDVAVATEEVYADTGVHTSEGWRSLEDIGLPFVDKSGRRYYSRFPIGAEYVKLAIDACQSPGMPLLRPGVFLTVSSVTGTAARGEELYRRLGAVCENMEGAAAAQTALLYDVPFVELRGISNMAGERDRESWDIALASSNCAKAAAAFIGFCMEVAG